MKATPPALGIEKPVSLGYKIAAIKILRRPEISKILIDSEIVPHAEIHVSEDGQTEWISLYYSKCWVEFHLMGIECPKFGMVN